jgi:hypothetical protein
MKILHRELSTGTRTHLPWNTVSGRRLLVVKNRILKGVVIAACIALQAPAIFGLGGDYATLRIIQTQTEFIRHTATEYQRRIAEQNAKAFFKQLTPAKKEELRRNHIKTVLIPTVRSAQTSPEAKEVKMRYSLEGESLIDNYAYEFKTPLQPGTVAKISGLDPEYVGQ